MTLIPYDIHDGDTPEEDMIVSILVPKADANWGTNADVEGVRMHYYRDVRVGNDGSVLVYDDIADHFTNCHSLTPEQVERARKLADEKRAGGSGIEVAT